MSKKLMRKKLAFMLSEQEQKKKRKFFCEVEYLECTGTQYIDTGLTATTSSTVDVVFGLSTTTQSGSTNGAVFGGHTSQTSNTFTLFYIASVPRQYFRFDYRGQVSVAYNDQITFDTISKYRFTYDGSVAETKNLTTNESFKLGVNPPDSTNTRTIKLFAVDTSGTVNTYLKGRVYSYKYSDETSSVDLIPVLDWDMRPAMYDKVSGELFYNQGTGEFSYGREIHQVEYLESTGTQCIDTGITQNSNIKAELSIYPTVINKFIFGSRISAGSDGFGIFMHSNNGGSWYTFFLSANAMIPGFVVNEKYDIEFSKDGLVVNNQFLEGPYTSVFTGTLNIYLFAMNSNGAVDTRLFIGKIYSTKLYENGVLVRDFIPAIDENGVGFMFDRVSHTIYDNAGTGAFKYPAVELEYIVSGGGAYIDTGIYPTDDYGYHIKNTYRRSGGEQCAIGCMDAGNRFVGVYTGGAQISGGWGDFVGYLNAAYQFTDDTIWDVSCNYKNDRQIVMNGEFLKDLTDTHITGTISRSIYIGGRRYTNTTGFYGKVYGAEITNGQDVIADFRPAYKDGQVGMWDKVGGGFYTTIGNGVFTAGKIIESEEE